MRTMAYRYPNERLILAATFFLVVTVIGLTVTATVCASLLFVGAFLALSYHFSASHHQQIIATARRVDPLETDDLSDLVRRGVSRIRPGSVEVYTLPMRELNAYTFGLSTPKVVVLYSGLFEVMDQDELLFILGHELGHVALGHTWLNSLVGGIAGIPSSFSAAAVMTAALLWWNRACEYSADRAGMLACGKPEKAISALVKLAAGPQAGNQQALQIVYEKIDAEDDTIFGTVNEALATHPMTIRRIEQLRTYSLSGQYKHLLSQLDRSGGSQPK